MATISEFINKIGFKVKNEDVNQVNRTISDIKNTATKVLGAIGIGFSLSAVNALVEEFTSVKQQISNATSGLGEQSEIQQKILAAATATRSTYQDTAKMVSSLVQENSELFGSVDEAIEFNNVMTMLFKTAGKSNNEIASLMESVNKSFAKGVVDTETINQLLEKSPEAVEYLNRKLGTTSDQLLDMVSNGKMSVQDLRDAFTDCAAEIESNFANVKMSITDAILVIRNKWGLWLADTNEMMGLTDTIGRVMVAGFDSVLRIITKVRAGVVWLSEKLGGMQNLLKLIVIVASTIFLAMNFTKITSGLSAIAKMLSKVNLKMVAIIAVIVLIALLVEDFINFMQGNNSLLGSMLEQAGIDSEAVRETIINAWEAITIFLGGCWEAIKGLCSTIWGAIKDFFVENGDSIKAGLTAVWDAIKGVLLGVWGIIQTVAMTVFNGLRDFWAENGESIMTSLSQIWNGILNLLAGLWDTIQTLAVAVFNGLQAFWEIWGGTIQNIFSSAWEFIQKAFSAGLDILDALLDTFATLFSGDWDALWESVGNLVSTVWESIQSVVGVALDGLSSILSSAWDSIVATATSVWESVKSAISEPIEDAKALVKSGIDAIAGFFSGATFTWPKIPLPHFSVSPSGWEIGDLLKGSFPSLSISWYKEGGILDGAQIFGAMGNNLLGGGEAGKEAVLPLSELWTQMKAMVKDGVTTLTNNLMPMMGMQAVAPSTVSTVTTSTTNRNIVQNVEINNEFNGDKAIQKEASTAMKKSSTDVTAELARGLAFAK